MIEWKSIESAPKDRIILARHPEYGISLIRWESPSYFNLKGGWIGLIEESPAYWHDESPSWVETPTEWAEVKPMNDLCEYEIQLLRELVTDVPQGLSWGAAIGAVIGPLVIRGYLTRAYKAGGVEYIPTDKAKALFTTESDIDTTPTVASIHIDKSPAVD